MRACTRRLGELPFDWPPASEEAKCVTIGNCPLFLLVAADSVECDGPTVVLIGYARLSRSYFQIKNLLNSYRAGAHCNLITLDVSALFSVEYRGVSASSKILTPQPPLNPASESYPHQRRWVHSPGGEGVGVNILEDAWHRIGLLHYNLSSFIQYVTSQEYWPTNFSPF